MTKTTRTLLTLAASVLLLGGLSACHPEAPTATPTRTASAPEPVPSATSSPEQEVAVFVAPTGCTGLLGAPLENALLAKGNVLFSGPGGTGLYSPIASTQTGGAPLSCWYGMDLVDLSTFEIAAQGLSQAAHEGTLAALEGSGLTGSEDGETVTFTQVGDEGTTPAILHVLRPDSWVTVYSTFGGSMRLGEMTGWLDAVEKQLYPAP